MNQPLKIGKIVKIVKVGDAFGVVLPEDLLARLGVAQGDDVYLSETDGGYRLSRTDPTLERKLALAEQIMREDREVLRVLAR